MSPESTPLTITTEGRAALASSSAIWPTMAGVSLTVVSRQGHGRGDMHSSSKVNAQQRQRQRIAHRYGGAGPGSLYIAVCGVVVLGGQCARGLAARGPPGRREGYVAMTSSGSV